MTGRSNLAVSLALALLVPVAAIGGDSPEAGRTADGSAVPSSPPELRVTWQLMREPRT